jgi:hypothetical protein
VSGRSLALLLAASAASVTLLAGCGDETAEPADTAGSGSTSASAPTGSASSTAPASDLPSCEEVWVAGEQLPAGYRGCFDGTADVLPEPLRCSNGQTILTYDPYWAVPGAKVQETDGLDTDPAFATVKNQCQA